MADIRQSIVEAPRFQMAYALFRITLGVNMFFHGFMRIISAVSYTHLTLPTIYSV